MKNRWVLAAVSQRKVKEALADEVSEEVNVVENKKSQTPKRTTARTRKKLVTESAGNVSLSVTNGNITDEENMITSESKENSKKTRTRLQKKDESGVNNLKEKVEDKKMTKRRRTKKQVDSVVDQESAAGV